MADNDLNSFKLSRNITVGKYISLLKKENKREIANFVYERFFERYIKPLENIPKKHKNGFCIMANCSLMIEALESFYQGWEDTNERGKGKKAFREFFERVSTFNSLANYSDQFHKNVRCGILHQAETTGGWRIHRKGLLFDSKTLTVNASEFFKALKKYLNDYQIELEQSDWDSTAWKNLRRKMDAIIKNCQRQ